MCIGLIRIKYWHVVEYMSNEYTGLCCNITAKLSIFYVTGTGCSWYSRREKLVNTLCRFAQASESVYRDMLHQIVVSLKCETTRRSRTYDWFMCICGSYTVYYEFHAFREFHLRKFLHSSWVFWLTMQEHALLVNQVPGPQNSIVILYVQQ